MGEWGKVMSIWIEERVLCNVCAQASGTALRL